MADWTPVDPVEAAERAIRDYCGWHVAPVRTETLTLDGTGTDTLLLPSRRVKTITAVTVDGTPLTVDDYEWSEGGMLRRRGCAWPCTYRSITVTLEHGYDDASALAGVAAAIAARVRIDPTGALASQRAGTQSVGFTSGAAGSGLMAHERAILDPYRLTWGP